jgi:hypothetical protein
MTPSCLQEQQQPPPAHQNFIDWMKATGMLFIVFGHVVGAPFNQLTQPIYPKQLGVAFFVFVVAWSLANDSRPRLRLLYNRLFPVYFFGIGFAVFLSCLFLFLKNDTNPSNYLPFFLGANVFFNHFPANPTTWYIGTYLHLLLFWFFFLYGKTIKKRHVFFMLLCEICLRSLLLASGKSFVAYMLLPNWGTIFLLGFLLAKKRDISTPAHRYPYIGLWLTVFALWAAATNSIDFDTSFPFRKLLHPFDSFAFSSLAQSILVTLVYCIHTILFFAIARRLPRLPVISFFSRNTLIIFIAHMPVIYGTSSYIYSLFEPVWLKKTVLILLLYVGLAIVSEIISKMLDVKKFREKTWQIITPMLDRAK